MNPFVTAGAAAMVVPLAGLPGSPERRLYKTVADEALALHVYRPSAAGAGVPLPAIVFFFGGGWRMGTVRQFVSHARYFCSRGMVAAVADYRVSARHNVTPFECVADAKSAMRWLRRNARELGIDSTRIVASGGSAGAHLAACTALIDGFDEPGEDLSVSCRPGALVLFNPVLDLIDLRRRRRDLAVDGDYLAISPIHHVAPGGPPTIIFHGRDDEIVDFATAQRFREAYRRSGNTCALHGYEGRTHGFFNPSRSRADFVDTVRLADEFLTGLGFLSGPADLDRLESVAPAL